MKPDQSVYGPASQERMLDILDDFVAESAEKVENNPIPDFPTYDEIAPNQTVDTQFVIMKIAEYEYDLTQRTNLLSDIMVKRIQSRLFLNKALRAFGDAALQSFPKNMNFYIARLTDLEAIYRTHCDSLEKSISALRGINTHSHKA